MKYLAFVPLLLVGCTLTEWGKVAEDTATEAAPVLTDPTTYSSPWAIGAGVVTILVAVYRKSLARNFGRAVSAIKTRVTR